MKLEEEKWYLIAAMFISLVGIVSVIPSQNNQFNEAVNVFAEKQNINKEQLEIVTVSHQVIFLFHSVTLEMKIKDTGGEKIKATLRKWPFGSYYIKDYERT